MQRMFIGAGLLLIFIGLAFGGYAWQQPEAVVVLQWQTATELDVVGFNLYRSEGERNDFVKINLMPIPASSDPIKGASYKYEDKSVKAGQFYYYRLEDLDTNGTSTINNFDEPVEARSDRPLIFGSAALLGVMGLVLAFVGFRTSKA